MKINFKIISVFLSLFGFTISGFAQVNLVPNYSFEQYDTCPNAADQIQYAIGWSKYSIPASTPDYYNFCASPNSFGVPKSLWLYQPERRNCNAYAGLVTWGASGNDREHIGIQLSQSLIIGQKYFISFYSVMGELFLAGNYYAMPSNNIGIRFSTVAYYPGNPSPIDNFAQLYSSTVINDSINWLRISGSFIADSAYNYIILGNFFNDLNTIISPYSCGNCLNVGSYYLIDDICVSIDSALCNGGIDLLPCNVSVENIVFDDGIYLFPNPTTDFISISLQNNLNTEIILYDIFGKIIYSNRIENNNTLNINLSSFSSGTYFLKITNANYSYPRIKKIIKL